MDKEVMCKNLKDFDDIMHRYDIPYFFIFGTLLGAAREKDFIDWDSDVDVGCYYEHYHEFPRVANDLRALGFNVLKREEIPPQDDFIIRDNEKIEIWWFKKLGDERVYDNNIRYEKRFFEPLCTIEFNGRIYHTPNNIIEFLDITYGKDWLTPSRHKEYILGRSK